MQNVSGIVSRTIQLETYGLNITENLFIIFVAACCCYCAIILRVDGWLLLHFMYIHTHWIMTRILISGKIYETFPFLVLLHFSYLHDN